LLRRKHDAASVALIENGLCAIDEAILELGEQSADEPDHSDYYNRGNTGPSGPDSRSIFDDVDD
jgi:hypothetical protein